jgi:HAD superfamily hydrolase (TIGR01549 family)
MLFRTHHALTREVFLISPNGYSTILFDLDGTLRYSRPSFNEAFCDFICQLGVPDAADNRRETMRWLHYYWAQSPELLADLETYRDKQAPFWTNHARLGLIAYGCASDQASGLASELYRRMTEEYQPENWVPPDVVVMLHSLKESGFRLGVVSNRTQAYQGELEVLGLQSFFECAFAAGEVNAWKPEPEIFRHALDYLGVEAQETIYVGDKNYADVLGAQRAGLHPVLLDPDGIFPEAECPVIQTIGQLASILEK